MKAITVPTETTLSETRQPGTHYLEIYFRTRDPNSSVPYTAPLVHHVLSPEHSASEVALKVPCLPASQHAAFLIAEGTSALYTKVNSTPVHMTKAPWKCITRPVDHAALKKIEAFLKSIENDQVTVWKGFVAECFPFLVNSALAEPEGARSWSHMEIIIHCLSIAGAVDLSDLSPHLTHVQVLYNNVSTAIT